MLHRKSKKASIPACYQSIREVRRLAFRFNLSVFFLPNLDPRRSLQTNIRGDRCPGRQWRSFQTKWGGEQISRLDNEDKEFFVGSKRGTACRRRRTPTQARFELIRQY